MRVRRQFGAGWLTIAVAVLGACAQLPDARVVDPALRPSARPAVPVGVVSPTAAPVPGASAVVQAVPTAAVPVVAKAAVLLRPAGDVRALNGVVRIDAHYATTVGGGRLIGNDGAALIGNDGAGLIGNDGAGLIGNDGAGLIGNVGAAAVFVGSNLLSQDAASIVAAGGGNLIGKRRWALLDAATEPTRAALGAILPAAGIEVSVRDMATGQPLSLGVDEAGAPVYTVLSNVGGAYTVYLPANLDAGNAIVTAAPPASIDARQSFAAIASASSTTIAVDEDTTLTTTAMREALLSTFDAMLLDDGALDRNESPLGAIPGARERVERLRVAVQKGLTQVTDGATRRQRLAAIADVALSKVKLDEIPDPRQDRPAMAALKEMLNTLRRGSKLKLNADITYFDKQPFVIAANVRRDGEDAGLPAERRRPSFEIRKPSDLPDLILRDIVARSALFTSSGGVHRELRVALATVIDDRVIIDDMVEHMAKIMKALLFQASFALLGDDESTATAIREAERPSP